MTNNNLLNKDLTLFQAIFAIIVLLIVIPWVLVLGFRNIESAYCTFYDKGMICNELRRKHS